LLDSIFYLDHIGFRHYIKRRHGFSFYLIGAGGRRPEGGDCLAARLSRESRCAALGCDILTDNGLASQYAGDFLCISSIIDKNCQHTMSPSLALQYDFSLQTLNSFGIDAHAQAYLRVDTLADLQTALSDPALASLPRLLLGGGSNIVLTGNFPGLVLHMALQGKHIVADEADAVTQADTDTVLVCAAAGENWHGFVEWTLAQGLGGLENLALIPGTVGAAPIQNIGAYGVEIKDRFHSLTAFDTSSGATFTMNGADCRFGYRDSIFKQAEGRDAIILDVTFALPKQWQPDLRYAELQQALADAGIGAPSARQVADAVIAIRRRKLPDPAVIGNAGSFFKNPVVSAEACRILLETHPALVHHAQADGSEKLAAGWLIDQCGWKGRSMGAAGVYPKQALVLVNNGGARGADITALAAAIQQDVQARYGVRLEPEPVFV
jgi:UDP-N-acetylmuramate dehydrogenase